MQEEAQVGRSRLEKKGNWLKLARNRLKFVRNGSSPAPRPARPARHARSPPRVSFQSPPKNAQASKPGRLFLMLVVVYVFSM